MKKRNSSNENKNTLLLFLNRKIEKWVFEIQIVNLKLVYNKPNVKIHRIL